MPGEPLIGSLARLVQNPVSLAGSLLYVLVTLLWFYLLARNALCFIYPLLSLTIAVANIAGWLLLKEPMTLQRMAGISIVAAGVVGITRTLWRMSLGVSLTPWSRSVIGHGAGA